MVHKMLLFVVMVACLLISGAGRADDPPRSALSPLYDQVRKLVQAHYPEATVTLDNDTISFAFNTRTFMIHEAAKSGKWQDAFEMTGPQRSGIVGTLSLRKGGYGGAAEVPQKFNKRYFTALLMATEIKRHDARLYVHLYYPDDVSDEFLKAFQVLVNNFEKHIASEGD